MRLGDFRKETANLSDDLVLDNVMWIQDLPGYYDGRPTEYVDHKAVYTNEEKIRFYMFDSETTFWDYCDKDKSYEENLEKFLSVFVRGKNIDDVRWDNYVNHIKGVFRGYWYSSEWQRYITTDVLVSGKFYWFRQKIENIWRVGYVGEDPDENQYLHVTGLNVPWEVNEMDLECFEFVLLESPL
jgi:hypothetical protein